MWLTVEHVTRFSYDGSINEAYTEIRLKPAHRDGQRCSSFALATEPRATFPEVLGALRRSFWSLTLPALVLGGMYFGVFTATEAAAAGALGALLIAAFVYRNFGWNDLWRSAVDASRNSAMLFLILAAAALLGNVLTKLRIPNQMVDLVAQHGVYQIGEV